MLFISTYLKNPGNSSLPWDWSTKVLKIKGTWWGTSLLSVSECLLACYILAEFHLNFMLESIIGTWCDPAEEQILEMKYIIK